MEFTSLLVATDFSEESVEAFPFAAHEAETHGTNVHLVHILEGLPYPPYAEIGYEDLIFKCRQKEEQEAREKLNAYAKKYFSNVIVGIEVVPQENSIGHDLAHYAKDNSCDAIIMASIGSGYLGRVLLGSTVLRVLEYAFCPVIVIPKIKEK